jgi:hypothetical protein
MRQASDNQRMDSVLRQTIWGILTGEVNTIAPGEIVSYDAASQTVSVQPVNKIVFEDGSEMLQPILQDVPVVFPGGGGFVLTFPILEGDTCLLVFAQRSLDAWLDSGTPIAPDSGRKFSISDAVALVGLRHSKNVLNPAPSTDGIELRTTDQGTFLKVCDGVVRIEGDLSVSGKVYAADCVVNGQVVLATHTHPTGVGPSGTPIPIPTPNPWDLL